MMTRQRISLLLLLLLMDAVLSQDDCDVNSCHPQLGDLMVGRAVQLSASSTCGLGGPQNYCILGYLEEEQKCFNCDSRSPYNLYNNPNSHQIENIITTFEPERKMRWWQSESGLHQVSIKLDLETLFQFSHLVLTFKSFRPAAMLVERSKDFGQSWKVFRYFAADCASSFPGVSEGPADSVDDVICDSRYSGAEPSTDGEVVLKALDPSFDIDNPYDPAIQDLITMTNLRVNFTRLLTLGDTLLGRKRRNPQDKYYYALYEMVVRGSCFCNGHASQCMPVDSTRGDVFMEAGMVHGRCVCYHNTVGHNCQRCQDFYNDAPWRPASTTDPNVCRRCNCNGHSETCHFDIARYTASREVSGGVCDDCRNNRGGAQCEQCKPFYYQDPRRSVEDPEACISCDCNPTGSLDGGLCDAATGQCVCKKNVEGDRCDQCKFGFYGLRQDDPSGCQMCRCNLMGSVRTTHPCDQTTGECICQYFATGPQCDQCVPGYWGLGNTVYSCLLCDCDIGGAYSSVCSSVDGQCPCQPNMVGLSCSEPAPGHFLAPLDFYLYEAENAAPLDTVGSSLLNPPSPGEWQPPQVDPTPYPDEWQPPPVYPNPYPDEWQPPPPVYPNPYPVETPPPRPVYPNPYPDEWQPPPVYPTPYPVETPQPPPPIYPNPYPDEWQPPPVYPTPYPDETPPSRVNLTPFPGEGLPKCEHYYRERGYDFKFSNGRYVLVKRDPAHPVEEPPPPVHPNPYPDETPPPPPIYPNPYPDEWQPPPVYPSPYPDEWQPPPPVYPTPDPVETPPPRPVYPNPYPDEWQPPPIYPNPYPDEWQPPPVYPNPYPDEWQPPPPVYPNPYPVETPPPRPVYPNPYPDEWQPPPPVYPNPYPVETPQPPPAIYPNPYPDEWQPPPVYPSPYPVETPSPPPVNPNPYPDEWYPSPVNPNPYPEGWQPPPQVDPTHYPREWRPPQVDPIPYPDETPPPPPVYPNPYPDEWQPPPLNPTPFPGEWQPPQENPTSYPGEGLPKCEHYYRERGYDFKFSNGRYVLVKRDPAHPAEEPPPPVHPNPYPDETPPPPPIYPNPYPDEWQPPPVYPPPYPVETPPPPLIYPNPYPDEWQPPPVYPPPYPVEMPPPPPVNPNPYSDEWYPSPVNPNPYPEGWQQPSQVDPTHYPGEWQSLQVDPIPYPVKEPPPQENPTSYPGEGLPKCEHYYRERGYNFKFSNGKFMLVKRQKRRARKRRQGQRSIPLEPGSALQILPRERAANLPVTWTGPGFVRVLDRAGLRFTVTNVPASLDYHLVIRYEPESPDNWAAMVKVVPLGPSDNGNCQNDPSEKIMALPGSARAAILDPPVCLNSGERYYVDVTLRKQANANPRSSSHILVDSMGLIPKMESLQNFCSESDLDKFQQYRCVELGAKAGEHTLPEECEGLIGSMSAYIHKGAVPCRCNFDGAFGTSCSKFGGQCQCKANVIGRCCDSCAPLTFGFGPNGCRECNCDPSGSTAELCDQRSGQCACRREVTGQRCDQCLHGHFDFPDCRPCECNDLADHCDPVTGACLDCREHSTGHNCDRCVDGYYGDPVSKEPCEPCLCPGVKGSGRFFARSCSRDPDSRSLSCACKTRHTGPRCDACAPGSYGDLSISGARCKECPCNNNIDPWDGEACDPVTGTCLRCLHNTHGPRCQSCKPGYYGNALVQECKECSCDRRGTEVIQCPLRSPCFCDLETGQCPCRVGAVGSLCNECDDGYWNLDGESGCQPCNCDPEHSLNNHCDKITGQCSCRTEFGGRQCHDCGENYFGNPDIQCIYCDCNMEGTLRPACDPYTGECMCRPGVTGIFCDECAPEHDSVFPACAPCHPCALLWAGNVTDVQRAAKKMRTLVPRPDDRQQPGDSHLRQRMLDLQSQLEMLANLTGNAQPKIDEVEDLLSRIKDLKDTIDPNAIIIDTTPLLNTDIDNIQHEFKRLLDNLKDKAREIPMTDAKDLNEALEEIRKLHKDFTNEEKRLKDAKATLDSSRAMRQDAALELASCHPGDWDSFERKVKALSVTKLNEEICGAPGDAECLEAKCGGALCGKCGGPTCRGSVPVSHNATETAEKTESDIIDLLHKLRESEIKINDAKHMNEDVKDQAEEMKLRISDTKEKFEREKNDTKDLIKRVKDYLTDEFVEPEDIEKLANAVLAISLPGSPDEIWNMIKNIQDMLAKSTEFQEDLEDLERLEDQEKTVEDMLEKARDIKDRTKAIDVSDIKKALEDAEKLQDKVSKDLEDAKQDKDTAAEKLKESETKLENAEKNLNSRRVKELLDGIEALKNKTEMNQEQGEEAKAAADAALANATDANTDLEKVKDLFKKLMEKNTYQDLNDMAKERLKNITMEAEEMAKEITDKMNQIEELENRIQDSIKSKEQKIKEVAELLAEAEALRKFILTQVELYFKCTS